MSLKEAKTQTVKAWSQASVQLEVKQVYKVVKHIRLKKLEIRTCAEKNTHTVDGHMRPFSIKPTS